MNLTATSKYIVENTPGVLSFVGPKGKAPVPLRDNEVKRIRGEAERKEGIEIIESPYKQGDAIKVIAGPFIDFTGFVDIKSKIGLLTKCLILKLNLSLSILISK